MTSTFTYRRAAELPGLVLPWQYESAQDTWTNLDLSTGYTFTLLLRDRAGSTVLTKTSGITGGDGTVTIAWATDELDLTPDTYTLHLRATDGSSQDRDYSPANPVRVVIVA